MPPFTKPGTIEEPVNTSPVAPVEQTQPMAATETTPVPVTPLDNASKAQSKRLEATIEKTEAEINTAKEMADLKKQIADLTKLVQSTADKGRLNQFNEQNKEGLTKLVEISTYKTKVVLAWSDLITNKVELHQHQMHTYDQTTELTYLDGSTEKVDYQIWQRDKKKIKSIVKEEKRSKAGTVFLVSTELYGDFDIDMKFVN